jgi:hypothetical protein
MRNHVTDEPHGRSKPRAKLIGDPIVQLRIRRERAAPTATRLRESASPRTAQSLRHERRRAQTRLQAASITERQRDWPVCKTPLPSQPHSTRSESIRMAEPKDARIQRFNAAHTTRKERDKRPPGLQMQSTKHRLKAGSCDERPSGEGSPQARIAHTSHAGPGEGVCAGLGWECRAQKRLKAVSVKKTTLRF